MVPSIFPFTVTEISCIQALIRFRKWFSRVVVYMVSLQSVVQELFQYAYDAQGITSILEALVLWMAEGHLNVAPNGGFHRFLVPVLVSFTDVLKIF